MTQPTKNPDFYSLAIPIWGLFLLAILVIFYLAQSVLIPVFLAALMALLLNPAVVLVCKIGIARPIGSALLITVTTGVFIFLLSYLSEPASVWFERLPTEIRLIEKKILTFKNSIETVQKTTEQISDMTDIAPSKKSNSNVVVESPDIFKQLLQGTQSLIVSILIFLALLYFSLAFGPQLAQKLGKTIGDEDHRDDLRNISYDAQQQISHYLLSITIINIVLGVIAGGLMYFLDMPNPIVWGASTALLNFIPYLGPAINLTVITLVSLLTFDHAFAVLLPPLTILLLNILEGQFVQPLFVGHMLTVSPIIIFLFILFWGSLWGMAGIFMAVPILVIVKIIVEQNMVLSSERDEDDG